MALQFPANPAGQTPVNTYSPDSLPEASTNGVTYIWSGNHWDASVVGDIQAKSFNGGPLAGFRNQLINGDFRVIQRITTGYNTNFSTPVNDVTYGADRWCTTSASASQVRVNQSSDGSWPNYQFRNAANQAGLRQAIELPAAGQCGPFRTGTTWTLSVWSDRDLTDGTTGSPFIRFVDSAANNTNAAATLSSNWIETGEPARGTFNRYKASFTIDSIHSPLATNQALEVVIHPKNNEIAQAYGLAEVQFEPGSVATPFELRPISTEMTLCQRYYQIVGSGMQGSQHSNLNNYTFSGDLSVEMRDDPSALVVKSDIYLSAIYSTSGGAAANDIGNVNITGTNLRILRPKSVVRCRANLSSSVVAGVVYASSTDFLGLDAEL